MLYRKSSPDRKSIENVFLPLERLEHISRLELPCDLQSPLDIIRLFWFGLKIKQKNIHITGDIHYMAFFLFWKKVILTIHDCNHYEKLSGIKKWLMGVLWYRLPIKFANITAVISPFTREQLAVNFKIDKNRIRVIPNSFIPVKKRKVKKDTSICTILTIGSLELKNQLRLVKAVINLLDIRLIFVGKIKISLKQFLDNNNIVYEQKFNIDRQELEECYNQADVLFFASTKEGFGLPILEAQSCGLPVITSNISSMPYVAGEGAHLVDPYNVEEIKNALLLIKNDTNYKRRLIEEGFNNTLRFSEQEFIASYEDLYNEVFKTK